MRHQVVVSVLALVLIVPSVAGAKPKKSNGCTMAQIQSAAASACMAKLDADVMSGNPTTHALYCSSTGALLCCEYTATGQVVDHSCTVVGIRRVNNGLVPNGTLTVRP